METNQINNNFLPSVSFVGAISNGFKNYSNFEGRSRRSDFWYFALFNTIFIVILFFANIATGRADDFERIMSHYPFIGFLDIVYTIVMIIPITSSIVRRLHDIGKSGCYIFLIMVPISGFIVLIIHLSADSEQKDNKYGPSQKYILGNNILIQNTNINNIPPIQSQNKVSQNDEDINPNNESQEILWSSQIHSNYNY